jgi:hypothetical protein
MESELVYKMGDHLKEIDQRLYNGNIILTKYNSTKKRIDLILVDKNQNILPKLIS